MSKKRDEKEKNANGLGLLLFLGSIVLILIGIHKENPFFIIGGFLSGILTIQSGILTIWESKR